MVGVVVVDAGAVALALQLEAAGDPRELARAPARRPRASKPASDSPPSAASALATLWRPGHPQDDLGVDPGAAGAKAAAPSGLGPDLGRDQLGARASARRRWAPERETDDALALLPGQAARRRRMTRPAAEAAKAAKASESSASEPQREW